MFSDPKHSTFMASAPFLLLENSGSIIKHCPPPCKCFPARGSDPNKTEKSPSYKTTGFDRVMFDYTARVTLPLRRQRVQT